jgi:hypothetical protein
MLIHTNVVKFILINKNVYIQYVRICICWLSNIVHQREANNLRLYTLELVGLFQPKVSFSETIQALEILPLALARGYSTVMMPHC